MSYQRPRPSGGRELEEFGEGVAGAVNWLLRHRLVLYAAMAVALLAWLASGFYIVEPGEEGVIRTFGRFSSVSTAGLNYRFPWPLQTLTKVDVESIRRVEIGFRSSTTGGKQEALSEALMLTEDENIVQVELLIQYRVASSRDFVFNVQDPEDVLLGSAEVALRSTVGQMSIDAVITEERALVQDQTRKYLSQLMDDYKTGIQVTDVRLQVADPPAQVRDAFQEVVRAKADRERLINEAEAYQNDVVPRARGDKQRLIEEAMAFKGEQVLRATGDAERFLAVLQAYRVAPAVTRERLAIEALESVLSRVKLLLLDDRATGNQVLPLLPLGDLTTPAPLPAVPAVAPAAAPQEGGE